jgi:DNA-binding response OmpR family regulator
MPDMNGFQVLERLKADERLREIPVIMISGLRETDSVIRCIEAGAEDYLPKPFDPVLLRARIGACLERKRWHDRERHYLARLEAEKARPRPCSATSCRAGSWAASTAARR